MAQYIEKSALVAEIELLQAITMDEDGNFYTAKAQAEYNVLCMLESFLDNLEVKDANEALQTEYEKGRAYVITKTLEWINVFNDNNYIMQYSDSCEHPINEIIEWYKNYINRE